MPRRRHREREPVIISCLATNGLAGNSDPAQPSPTPITTASLPSRRNIRPADAQPGRSRKQLIQSRGPAGFSAPTPPAASPPPRPAVRTRSSPPLQQSRAPPRAAATPAPRTASVSSSASSAATLNTSTIPSREPHSTSATRSGQLEQQPRSPPRPSARSPAETPPRMDQPPAPPPASALPPQSRTVTQAAAAAHTAGRLTSGAST